MEREKGFEPTKAGSANRATGHANPSQTLLPQYFRTCLDSTPVRIRPCRSSKSVEAAWRRAPRPERPNTSWRSKGADPQPAAAPRGEGTPQTARELSLVARTCRGLSVHDWLRVRRERAAVTLPPCPCQEGRLLQASAARTDAPALPAAASLLPRISSVLAQPFSANGPQVRRCAPRGAAPWPLPRSPRPPASTSQLAPRQVRAPLGNRLVQSTPAASTTAPRRPAATTAAARVLKSRRSS